MLLLALIGGATAVGFTSLSNLNRDSAFEALIPIRFDPEEGQSIEDVASEIEDARGLALLAAEDLFAEYPESNIFADAASARLIFVARGETANVALERASALIQAYFDTDPVVGGDVTELLAEYERQATELESQIQELQPTLPPAQETLVAQHDLLDKQINAVEAQIVTLTVADSVATPAQRESNAEERTRLDEILSSLLADKAALAPRPEATLSAAAKLQLDALQRQLALITVDYARLALRTVGVSGGGRLEPATFRDLTPSRASPLMNGAVGFFGGMALGVFAVSFVARSRREFWLPEDLPVPILAEVSSRKTTQVPGPPWYDAVPGGKRKAAIQALRTSLEGVLGHGSASVAVVGEKVGSEVTHALAADLATSFASAGVSVLLVDADYESPAQISEYNVGDPKLDAILGLASWPKDSLESRVREVVARSIHLRSELAIMPAGAPPLSPADVVAGSQFRALLEEARSRFDLVLVAAGSSKSPVAQVVAQRVGTALLVVSPGQATSTGVAGLIGELAQQRVDVIGAVSIHGSERLLPVPLVVSRQRSQREDGVASVSATSRLSRYPFPGSRASSAQTGGSFRNLADELADAHVLGEVVEGRVAGDVLGAQVLDSLRHSDNGRAYRPVAQYVVARVEDIMTATAGQANLTPRAIDVIIDYGFVPFVGVDQHPSIGDQLIVELSDELGKDAGVALAAEFARVLGGPSDDPVTALNRWIEQEFFVRHVERTQREPEVWHLTSEAGSVQLLVNGRRLDKQGIDKINVELVRRLLDSYEKELGDARDAGDEERVSEMEERLRDAHLFQIALGLLQVGSSEEARLVYPWRRAEKQPRGWDPVWTEGIKANIAPLQRLGLLAAPVLTDSELALSSTNA